MRTFLTAALFTAFIAHAALAQSAPAAPPPKVFTNAAEVSELIAKAKASLKEGQLIAVQPILSLAPYRASLEYRVGNSPPALHEKNAEVFYVIEGTATLVTGGKLVDEKRTNPANLSGTSITGGQPQAIAKGDFFVVPENTAHQIMPTGGAPVVLMSMYVPRPIPQP